jgi:DNA-binding MarR family transcriptional regulator
MAKTGAGGKRTPPRKSSTNQDASGPETDSTLVESFVGYNLRRAAAKQRERFRSVFGPYDIRPVQLTVLALIRDSMPIKQAALGKALEVKRANIVTLLDELEGRGLVMRQPSDNDRRSHVLYLTPAGKTLTNKLLALHAKLEQDLARSLGKKELTQLVELLSAFRTLDSNPKLS